jgi:hypothetical protein
MLCRVLNSTHLQLKSTTTTVGDRSPRNICQELTITALPGNQFTVSPRKTKKKSIAKQEYKKNLDPYDA